MTELNTTPAVVFDPTAWRAWLSDLSTPMAEGTQANTERFEKAEMLGIAYQRASGEAAWLVQETFLALTGSVGVWTYGPGVEGLRIWATASPEGGPDGGLVGEINVGGALLSIGSIAEAKLIPTEHDIIPGHEAAELALTTLAGHINAAVNWYRAMTAWPARKSGLAAQLSDEQLELALTALAALHSSNGASGLFDDERKAAETVVRVVDADRRRRADEVEVVDAEIVG